MSLLHQYGWNLYFEQFYTANQEQGLEAGRVTAIHGHQYVLMSQKGALEAELSGSLLNGKDAWELPKVGDWVVFTAYDKLGYIIEVLPRHNELARKQPGRSMEKQVLAANVDFAFILQGVDRDFNLMRLQRYLHQVNKSKIKPIIILNKKDLVEQPEFFVNQVNTLGFDCPVVLTSALSHQSLEELKTKFLQAGKTYILLGSSGVGKSTLMNALLGFEMHTTDSVSKANHKGKHTTTSRHLVMLSNGSLIIDSPGMREFGLTTEDDEAITSHHPQIEELSAYCRFYDCTHQHEPGCAVRAATERGLLPVVVYQSYLKLFKEQYRYGRSVAEKRRAERHFGKIAREAKDFRKKSKY